MLNLLIKLIMRLTLLNWYRYMNRAEALSTLKNTLDKIGDASKGGEVIGYLQSLASLDDGGIRRGLEGWERTIDETSASPLPKGLSFAEKVIQNVLWAAVVNKEVGSFEYVAAYTAIAVPILTARPETLTQLSAETLESLANGIYSMIKDREGDLFEAIEGTGDRHHNANDVIEDISKEVTEAISKGLGGSWLNKATRLPAFLG